MSKNRGAFTIDLDAIDANLTLVSEGCPDSKIMVVIKADAYGLGAVPIALHLQDRSDVAGFGVATVEEGEELRRVGINKPIFILSIAFSEDYPSIINNNLTPTITCIEDAKLLSEESQRQGKSINIDIKIDTGMGRIGFAPTRENIDIITEIFTYPGILPGGIFTHFPCADMLDIKPTLESYNKFKDMVEGLKAKGIDFKYVHCQNSAASLVLRPDNTNLIRAGIITYGVNPLADHQFAKRIQNVVSFTSHINFLKEVPQGSAIGYGGTFVTDRVSKIATVPVGYADGIPRELTAKGYVLIRGQKARIAGRVCMDQMMIDVTDIPNVKRFDQVTILGTDGEESIGIEELSQASGRFTYELLTCLGKRVERIYYKKEK